jgi:hypothetical protein
MTSATLADAWDALQVLRTRLAGVDGIQAVGIAPLAGGYAVKINLRNDSPHNLPLEIDGVPVIVEVVGIISARQ